MNEMDEVREIPLSEIEWPDPAREEISDKDIDDMAKSFMATGQIQAIVVEEVGLEKYHGVIGRLRFLGAQKAHAATILCRIHSFMEESEKKIWQLVENVMRRELNAMVKAETMDKIRQNYEDEIGGPQPEIVDSIRKEVEDLSGEKPPSKRSVWRYLELAKAVPEDVKKLLRGVTSVTFGVGHADQLLRLKEDHNGMLKATQFIIQNQPTVAGLKSFITDYQMVQIGATDQVKEAVDKKEISLKHGAALAGASAENQEQILDLAKKGDLNPVETKKIVDFASEHGNRMPELLAAGKKDPEKAVAIARGKEGFQTEENCFFRSKKVEEFKVPCKCPLCLASFESRIIIDWERGEIKYV